MGRRNESQWISVAASLIFAALVGISLIWASRSYGIPAFSQVSDLLCHLP